jgi:peptidoglycan/xylan/chitin deacetylase (PgdA/CDA1 family)
MQKSTLSGRLFHQSCCEGSIEKMRRFLAVACWLALIAGTLPVRAEECANPNALGTSRTLVVDPTEHPRLGTMQYLETLPLADHEVVLTFDDGPLPPYTNRILEILAAQCVKATYFLVGRMAHSFPETVRHIYNSGHTIGTHSQNHPLTFHKMPLAMAQREVDDGIASVTEALGDPRALAPFFRIPGLLRANGVENYLASRSLVTWSADFPADDWFRRITPNEITKRALRRIEAKGKGILLLHDIHPATVLALPTLLKELKARGYHIVQVVPSGPERPKTVTEPQQWVIHSPKLGWPRVVTADAKPNVFAPSPQSFGVGNSYPFGPSTIMSRPQSAPRVQTAAAGQVPLPRVSPWPRGDQAVAPVEITGSTSAAQSRDWPQTMPPLLASHVASEPAAWPLRSTLHPTPRPVLRPTLRSTESRTTAAKPRPPAKPARPALVTSSLSQWLSSFTSPD